MCHRRGIVDEEFCVVVSQHDQGVLNLRGLKWRGFEYRLGHVMVGFAKKLAEWHDGRIFGKEIVEMGFETGKIGKGTHKER